MMKQYLFIMGVHSISGSARCGDEEPLAARLVAVDLDVVADACRREQSQHAARAHPAAFDHALEVTGRQRRRVEDDVAPLRQLGPEIADEGDAPAAAALLGLLVYWTRRN